MNDSLQATATSVSTSRPFLPFLLLLFAGSGCSALIYEIVWFQLLELVIGSSAVSLAVLLGTFMGGMCLGSLILPRLLSLRMHPLRVYAGLEALIGAFGLMAPWVIPSLDRLYVEMIGRGLPGILLRGVIGGLCLLAPTMLMGATLPAIARWVETTTRGISWLGLFYGGNIAGAVFGCLLAGFYLLRIHDLATASYVAVTLNAAVALVSLCLAALSPRAAEEKRGEGKKGRQGEGEEAIGNETPRLWSIYVVIGISGATALGAEVIWTRLLSLLLGATVYTFSIILAVFLIGLGLGSSVGSILARSSANPRALLGACQWLLAGAIAWTAFIIAESLPYWPINPYLSTSPWYLFQLDLLRCLWAILPATCLWGASFPLALAAVAGRGQDPGRLVGDIYAANTVGAIIGAVGTSLFLIPVAGTEQSQRLLIGLSALAGLFLLAPLAWPFRDVLPTAAPLKKVAYRMGSAIFLLTAIGISGFLVVTASGPPWELIAYGRSTLSYLNFWTKLYAGEGMNASVAVTETETGIRNFHVSGKVEASTEGTDMRLQRMLGHVPALLHRQPKSVLVVGCGAGVTAGSFVPHPDVERIVICEIEPLVPRVVAEFFKEQNFDVVHDRRTEMIYDDARHYILTSRDKFDIITSDPIHPWVKGSATLYTKEYFELCREHLNPGGLITQWVPLYETTADVVKSEIATFFEVFPEGTVWANNKDGQGYDIVLLGSAGPMQIDVDELQKQLDRPDHAFVLQSLTQVGFAGTVSLFKTYTGRASDLKPWLEDAQINRDRNLRLQYLAGLGLNRNEGTLIYNELVSYRQFPDDLFVGSGMRNTALRWALQSPNSIH
jgi:spermidine synthase